MAKKGVTKEVRFLASVTSLYGWAGLFLLIAVGIFAYQYFGMIPGELRQSMAKSGDKTTDAAILSIADTLAAFPILFFVAALPLNLLYILIGSGLKRGKSKWLAYLGAIVALFNVPVGLALGVYTFVVLGRTENRKGFA